MQHTPTLDPVGKSGMMEQDEQVSLSNQAKTNRSSPRAEEDFTPTHIGMSTTTEINKTR